MLRWEVLKGEKGMFHIVEISEENVSTVIHYSISEDLARATCDNHNSMKALEEVL